MKDRETKADNLPCKQDSDDAPCQMLQTGNIVAVEGDVKFVGEVCKRAREEECQQRQDQRNDTYPYTAHRLNEDGAPRCMGVKQLHDPRCLCCSERSGEVRKEAGMANCGEGLIRIAGA